MRIIKRYSMTVEYEIDESVNHWPEPEKGYKSLSKKTLNAIRNSDIIAWYGESHIIELEEK